MDKVGNCGRTSAQMVIAALATPRAETEIITQSLLESEENNAHGSKWETSPGELAAMLNAHTPASWNVASRPDVHSCLGAVEASLIHKKLPVLLTHGPSDHWVVYREVRVESGDRHYDTVIPLTGNDPVTRKPWVHKLSDGCDDGGRSGSIYKPMSLLNPDLKTFFQLERDVRDRPDGPTYKDTCVTVESSLSLAARRHADDIASELKRVIGGMRRSIDREAALRSIAASAERLVIETALRFELDHLAEYASSARLERVTMVEDLADRDGDYLLGMLSSGGTKALLAVFTATALPQLVQYVFVEQDIARAQFGAPRLAWTSSAPSPSNGQRFFPYRADRLPGGQVSMTRMLDRFSFVME